MQPQKRGVPIDRPCPQKSPMFLDTLEGLLLSFNLKKKQLQSLWPKKDGEDRVFFDVERATKHSEVGCDL
jgi:hypothetical protein